MTGIVTLRFVRIPFGCTSSPFILGGTLHEHLDCCQHAFVCSKDLIEGIKNVQFMKDTANMVFKEGTFELHKFHSNIQRLEGGKGEYRVETKILGVIWRKSVDMLGIDYRPCKKVHELTKRGILKSMASVYDPLGLTSPLLLVAKLLYRRICERQLQWDARLHDLEAVWLKWRKSIPDIVIVLRCFPKMDLEITGIELEMPVKMAAAQRYM